MAEGEEVAIVGEVQEEAVQGGSSTWYRTRSAYYVYGPNGPYLIVVLTGDLQDEEAGADAIARLSRDVYRYFN